jgi:hypothetical protein
MFESINVTPLQPTETVHLTYEETAVSKFLDKHINQRLQQASDTQDLKKIW